MDKFQAACCVDPRGFLEADHNDDPSADPEVKVTIGGYPNSAFLSASDAAELCDWLTCWLSKHAPAPKAAAPEFSKPHRAAVSPLRLPHERHRL